VLLGNAAQTLHPVAGQGFNMGVRDAWELAQVVLDTRPAELGTESMLAAYRASLHPAWGRALSADPPLRLLLGKFRARFLPEERLRQVDPGLKALESLNEPRDLERVGAALPPRPVGPGSRRK